jgi:hypothetical protein
VAGSSSEQKNNSSVSGSAAKEHKSPRQGSSGNPALIASDEKSRKNQNISPIDRMQEPAKILEMEKVTGKLATTESQQSSNIPSISVNTDNTDENSAVAANQTAAPVVAAESNDFSLALAIEFRNFETPGTYGVISVKPHSVRIDSFPVYDPLYAYEDISQQKAKVQRWSVGGQMAPLYTYRAITDINAQGISKTMMDQSEKAVITYASGIKVDYEASSRLTLQTGVYYMRMGQEIENVSNLTPLKSAAIPLNSFAEANSLQRNTSPSYTNSTGTIIAQAPELYVKGTPTYGGTEYAPGNLAVMPAPESNTKDIEQSFEFIEVPFLAKYKLINRKINVHLLGGLSTHVLVNNKIRLVSDNSTNYGSTSDVETMNYSSSVGFGVVYKMSKNLLFSVEPTFKYYLNSFNSTDIVKLHPYAFGLYSGISFKF